jgi:hypothetical protein
MTFYSLPFAPDRPEATEARLEAIYEAARYGLKGDSLALAAGLTPAQYRRLAEFDALVEIAEMKGRADGELSAAKTMYNAAASGPRKWQRDLLQQLADHIRANGGKVDYDMFRKAVASGRGIGKSALVSWLVLWMLTTRIGATSIVSANSEAQLRSITWSEITKWLAMAINSHWFEISDEDHPGKVAHRAGRARHEPRARATGRRGPAVVGGEPRRLRRPAQLATA